MTFQTLSFLSLLVATLGVYWFLPRRGQNLLLLFASYVFYGYVDPVLTLLLAGFTLSMYAAALSVPTGKPATGGFRYNAPVVMAVLAAVSVLVIFKYLGFFVDGVGELLETVGLGTFSTHLNIILPIGVSFYSLQGLGYVIDVRRGHLEARRNLIEFALFISFFPQLVAGPIERAGRLLPQFESKRSVTGADLQSAVGLVLWGFFKKLVIADNVGVIADSIFATESPGFALVWVGVLAFGLQIFADFSGYTDIARGTARLFGIRLSENFHHPHIAASPAEFWRRWHVSLSTWFRDYVYIPLGGSRVGQKRLAINLVLTFLLSGLWHGASWNFAIWGLYHGLLVYTQRVLPFGNLPSGTARPVFAVITFMLISVGWLFFRESNLDHMWTMLTTSPMTETRDGLELASYLMGQVAILSIPVWLHTALDARIGMGTETAKRRATVQRWTARTATSIVLFTGILVLRNPAGGEFIYFQF